MAGPRPSRGKPLSLSLRGQVGTLCTTGLPRPHNWRFAPAQLALRACTTSRVALRACRNDVSRSGGGGLARGAPEGDPVPWGCAVGAALDAGAAATAGLAGPAVDPVRASAAQVAGGGLLGALLVGLEHRLGPAHQARQVGDVADRGVGWTPARKHSSAAYMLPMPARLRWSSSASPTGASGSAGSRRSASSSSQSGPSRSGPRWPTTESSSARADHLGDAEREADRRPVLGGAGRRAPRGPGGATGCPGGRGARSPPSSGGCAACARRRSGSAGACRGRRSPTTRPDRSSVANAGTRKSVR